jgi:hypothetical protein
VSTGVIAGLIWIGFAAHRPRTAAVMAALVERIPIPRHPAHRKDRLAWLAQRCQTSASSSADGTSAVALGPSPRRAAPLQQSLTRYPDITPGEELIGYS